MEKILLNDQLTLSIPDGFHIMSPEELSGLGTGTEPAKWGISDPERHMIVAVTWKKFNGLLTALAGTKDVAKGMEARLRGSMKQYGFELETYLSKTIGGQAADGIRYSYVVQGIAMTAELLAVKYNKTYYYPSCFFHQELRDESLRVWEGILESAGWA